MAVVVGVDTGGTFTDFLLLSEGRLQVHKLPSTPRDPSQAVLQGLKELGVGPEAVVIHGSTVATNALLERKGARTALLTQGWRPAGRLRHPGDRPPGPARPL